MQLREAYASELLGRPVELAAAGKGRRIGKVVDIAVAGGESFPPVVGFYVKGHDGKTRYAPMVSVDAVTDRSVLLHDEPGELSAASPPDEILLNKQLLDRQIVDVDGRKVVRVNDLKLVPAGVGFRLIAADIGLSGLLRRVGLRGLGRQWLNRAARVGLRQTLISWDAVQPLHRDEPGDVIRLRVPQDRIDRIHPADLAAIIEELNASDQASLVGSLNETTAAEAFEQLNVDTQLSILEDLKPDRAADIIENMSPDDAADLLAEVEPEKQQELLRLMQPAEAQDVRELLAHDEQTAGGLMTTEYLWVPPGLTVADAFEHIRKGAEDAELVYYFYVLDDKEHILGVVSLRDLLKVDPSSKIADIMIEDVVTVPLSMGREEVATTMARYDFVAMPVVDAENRMQGIVTVDDVVDVLLPEKMRKMLPRVGKSRSKVQSD